MSRSKRRTLPVEKGRCIADQIKLYINYLCDRLEVSAEVREKSYELYHRIRGNDEFLRGHSVNPRTVGAAIVYIASALTGEYVTQNTMWQHSGVSAQALRNCYVSIKQAFYR